MNYSTFHVGRDCTSPSHKILACQEGGDACFFGGSGIQLRIYLRLPAEILHGCMTQYTLWYRSSYILCMSGHTGFIPSTMVSPTPCWLWVLDQVQEQLKRKNRPGNGVGACQVVLSFSCLALIFYMTSYVYTIHHILCTIYHRLHILYFRVWGSSLEMFLENAPRG